MPTIRKIVPPETEPSVPAVYRNGAAISSSSPSYGGGTQLSLLTLSQSQLEQHLWDAANILRGPVDAADFKTYIFPLLFFKRICDVYDEEFQHTLDEAHGGSED